LMVRCGVERPSSFSSRSSISSASPRITRRCSPWTFACRPQKVERPPIVPAPPRNPYRSSRIVERPARAAAVAAISPAGPPPTTTTSNSPYTGVVRGGSVTVGRAVVGSVAMGRAPQRGVVRQPPPRGARHRLLAHRGEPGAGVDGVLVDEAADVGLRPAGAVEQGRVLGAQDDATADRLVDEGAGAGQRAGDVAAQLLGN